MYVYKDVRLKIHPAGGEEAGRGEAGAPPAEVREPAAAAQSIDYKTSMTTDEDPLRVMLFYMDLGFSYTLHIHTERRRCPPNTYRLQFVSCPRFCNHGYTCPVQEEKRQDEERQALLQQKYANQQLQRKEANALVRPRG